jgi:hypothetical protein
MVMIYKQITTNFQEERLEKAFEILFGVLLKNKLIPQNQYKYENLRSTNS